MADRRQFLAGVAAIATAGLAGCSGGDDDDGSDNGSDDGGSDDGGNTGGEGTVSGETVFEGDAGDHLELEHSAQFEEMDFAETMTVEGSAENTADDLRLHVELVVEMDRYLKTGTASESIDPGDTWDFTVEIDQVDQERIDEYTLSVAFTEPPEEV